jgi:hypothetical protein
MGLKSTRKLIRQNSVTETDYIPIFLFLVLVIGYSLHLVFVFFNSLELASGYTQSIYLQDHITSLYWFGKFEILGLTVIELGLSFWYYLQNSISKKQLLLVSIGIVCVNFISFSLVDFIYTSTIIPLRCC